MILIRCLRFARNVVVDDLHVKLTYLLDLHGYLLLLLHPRLLHIWIVAFVVQDGVIKDTLVPLFGVGLTRAFTVDVIFVVDCFRDVTSEARTLGGAVIWPFLSRTASTIHIAGLIDYVGELSLLVEPL